MKRANAPRDAGHCWRRHEVRMVRIAMPKMGLAGRGEVVVAAVANSKGERCCNQLHGLSNPN